MPNLKVAPWPFLAVALLVLPAWPAAAEPAPLFVDIAPEAGLTFQHWNGMTGKLHISEILGPGVAFLDGDGDGDLDILVLQGALLDPAADVPLEPPPTKPGARYFRNELIPSGKLSFVDVTEASGLRIQGYAMGVATGDIDGDGDTDLYVSHLGQGQLWRNLGGGRLEEVTAQAGLDGDAAFAASGRLWGTSASFFDGDGDGDLDLFVAHYVAYSPRLHKKCTDRGTAPDYCGPASFEPLRDHYYRNRGDGIFEEATLAAGFGRGNGPGLGTIVTDFDLDGRLDLYVANDGTENQLWHARSGPGEEGTFEDVAPLAGVAADLTGQPEGSMGVDAGDIDGDGDEDLIAVPLDTESKSLYRNTGEGYYEETTLAAGLAQLGFTSFGTGFFDFDLDGDLDLFVASGAVHRLADQVAAGSALPLAQRKQLFENIGQGRFRELPAGEGDPLGLAEVSRGTAFGDVDNDGDPDILVGNNNGPLRLLRNDAKRQGHWLGLSVKTKAGGAALGARVVVQPSGGAAIYRRVQSDGSYLSARDPRLQIGLQGEPAPILVRVEWPDRRPGQPAVEQWQLRELDRYHELRRGQGQAAAALALPAASAPETLAAATPEAAQPPAGTQVGGLIASEDRPATPPEAVGVDHLPVLPSLAGLEPRVVEQLQNAYAAALAAEGDDQAKAWALLAELCHAYRLEGTLDFYHRARLLAPSSFRAFYLGGLFALEKGQLEEAGTLFDQAAKLDPNSGLLAYHQAELEMARQDFTAAAARLDAFLARQPAFAAAEALRAQVAVSLEDYAAAARHYEIAMRLAPKASRLRSAAAAVAMRLGDRAKAESLLAGRGNGLVLIDDPLLREVEMRLLSAQHFQEIGEQSLRSGDHEAAIAAFRRAALLEPEDLGARANLGAALAIVGDKKAARAELEKVLERDPQAPKPLLHLAILLAEAGEEEKAIGLYQRLLDASPDDLSALINLGNLHRRRGELAEAAGLYRRASRRDTARGELRVVIVRVLSQLGRDTEALAEAERAYKELSENIGVQEALVRLLAAGRAPEARDGERALALARQAFEQSATFPVVEALAMACAATGRFEEAIAWQQKAIEVAKGAGRLAAYPQLEENLARYRRDLPAALPWP